MSVSNRALPVEVTYFPQPQQPRLVCRLAKPLAEPAVNPAAKQSAGKECYTVAVLESSAQQEKERWIKKPWSMKSCMLLPVPDSGGEVF